MIVKYKNNYGPFNSKEWGYILKGDLIYFLSFVLLASITRKND